jgi:hypothetical protein
MNRLQFFLHGLASVLVIGLVLGEDMARLT